MSAIGRGDLNEYLLELVKVGDLSVDDEDGVGLIPLVSPTTIHGAGVDDGYSGAVPIGFDFEFDGVVYTQLDMVSTNSYARLTGSVDSLDNTKLYDVAGSVDVILSPWWDDTETEDAVGYVKRETLGAEPSRRFVVEWRVLQQHNHTPTDKRVLIFQVVLYETSNRVEFRYAVPIVTGSPNSISSASVGVKRDTSGPAVAGNCRDFYGTDHTNGGSGKTPFFVSLTAVPAGHFPGDAANLQEGERFFFRLTPTLVPVVGTPEPPYTLPIGGLPESQRFDPVPLASPSEELITTLEQLVAISLFTDARADDDDAVPVEGDSKRGFWAQEEGDNFGSKLWLLERSKNEPETRARVRDYALEALQWLREDGVADAVEVELTPLDEAERTGITITITRGEEVVVRYPDIWEAFSNGT